MTAIDPRDPMPQKPDQAVIETAFQDPAELAAAAAAARAAAEDKEEDKDKTQELRPLRVTKVPVEQVGGPHHQQDERHGR